MCDNNWPTKIKVSVCRIIDILFSNYLSVYQAEGDGVGEGKLVTRS